MADIAERRAGQGDWLRDALPKLVLSPSFAIVVIFVYGFIVFTFVALPHRQPTAAVVRLGGLGELRASSSGSGPGGSRSRTC